jgi:hypothetical protein
MARRAHQRLRRFALSRWVALSLGAVASLAVAELLAYAYISWSGVVVAQKAGFEWKGNFTDYTAAYVHTYTMQKNGERPVCGQKPATPSYKLVVLGDSFGFGAGVADCHEFPSLVNIQQSSLMVRNASQVGGGMEDYIAIMEERVCGEGFDGLFLMLCGNDFLFPPASLLNRLSKYSSLAGLTNSVVRRMPKDNPFIRFLSRTGIVKIPPPGKPLAFTHRQMTVPSEDGKRRLLIPLLNDLSPTRDFARLLSNPPPDLAAKNLKLLHKLLARARECSKDVWVAVVPNAAAFPGKQRDFIASFGGTLPPVGESSLVEKMVRETAQEYGAHFVETDTTFAPEVDSAYYANDIHWTSRGHQIMAGLVLNELAKLPQL